VAILSPHRNRVNSTALRVSGARIFLREDKPSGYYVRLNGKVYFRSAAYSLGGKNFTSTRLGYLPLQAFVDTGITCCSPEGAGFNCTFDEIRLVQ